MLLLAKPAIALLLGHGAAKPHQTADAGAALAILAAGLPGFCSFLFVVRVLQSMQRTKVAFWLYLVENGINVVLALALVHSMSVRGPGRLAVGRLQRGRGPRGGRPAGLARAARRSASLGAAARLGTVAPW